MSETGTVYRIENEQGGGVYRSRKRQMEVVELCCKHSEDRYWVDHPTPEDEGFCPVNWNNKWLCGFENMESLETWFTPDEIAILKANGFYAQKFENVQIVEVLEKQVIFVKNQIILKKSQVEVFSGDFKDFP